MYLKSLELHGFKSFPNKTVLSFERGATVVVGPNGSGKSNISDAMRWVLGEISSRNIRGTKMEDVIFGGTDDRRPMGFAEVSVTFDNTDDVHKIDSPYDEITVTRRYYRSGDSEYLINKKPVRLKDIHELFMNTGIGREGYSIIGQGKIAEMISKKSEDRRNIFEEAAGIAKYRYKKQEAERKLEHTNDNIVRINDIWLELDTRIGPLERAAEKAKKYKGLLEKKREADVSLWLFDTKKLHEDIEKTKDSHKLALNEYFLAKESLESLENQSERINKSINDNMTASNAIFERIKDYQNIIADLENEYSLAINDRQHSTEKVEEFRASVIELDANMKSAQAELATHRGLLDELKKALSDKKKEADSNQEEQQLITKQIADCEKLLSESLARLTSIQKQGTDLQIRIDVIKNTKIQDSDKRESLYTDVDKLTKAREALAEEAVRCEKRTQEFKDKIAEYDTRIEESAKKRESLDEEKESTNEKLSELRSSRNDALQKIATIKQMEEQLEGYSESVKFVMNKYSEGKIEGAKEIYGPVSKLITMDSQYAIAIETALGANIQHIVVDDDNTAKAGILALKKAKAGRATFYPVASMKPQPETEEIRQSKDLVGYVGRADTLVDCDEKFRGIVECLLLRTVVFDNLDNASAAAKKLGYKVKLVTLDGQIVHAGGSYTGGSVKAEHRLFSRAARIEELTAQAEKLEMQIKELVTNLSEIDTEIAEAVNLQKDAEQEKQLMLSLSRTQFAALDQANAKLEANESLLAKLQSDLDNIDKNGKRCDSEIATLTEMLKDIDEEIEATRRLRITQEAERNALTEEREKRMHQFAQISIQLAELRKDVQAKDLFISNLYSTVSEYSRHKEEYLRKIAEFENGNASFDEKQKENRRKFAEYKAKIESEEKENDKLKSGNLEYGKRQSELKNLIGEAREKQEHTYKNSTNLENRLAKLTDDYGKLSEKLFEEHSLSYEEAVALNYPEVTKENRAEVAAVQASARASIRALGDINPAAEEEYKEVKERYDALTAQLDDLKRSQGELTEIVGKIEEEMKNKFITSFAEINKNFGITFTELFGGGTGELSLVDPDDILNSGIEIKAAPPGKIIKSLSLLSGGEQAFVAIALLFAILKSNPTPFCILDEIEAALDEVNVFRFGEYIRKFAEETQFVLITHRRGTMEIGDRLYGVTMPERGISRVIPINMNEVESKKKELLDGVL